MLAIGTLPALLPPCSHSPGFKYICLQLGFSMMIFSVESIAWCFFHSHSEHNCEMCCRPVNSLSYIVKYPLLFGIKVAELDLH